MNMKLSVLPLTFALSMGCTLEAGAAGNDCSAKRTAIESQIQQAQKYGNTRQEAGLKKALSELNAHCTEGGLIKDAQEKVDKLEKKQRDKQEDVREAQTDLREAQAKGDAKKIEKYQEKLQEKHSEATKIAEELRQARTELSALKG